MAKSMVGKATADAKDKTVVIVVESRRRHPLYGKAYLATKRFKVHDELNQAKMGDRVEIAEARKVSKAKSWSLSKVLVKGPKL